MRASKLAIQSVGLAHSQAPLNPPPTRPRRFDVFLSINKQGSLLSDGFTAVHRRAMQRALELQRMKTITYLLSLPGCTLDGLHLARLYAIEDKFRFLHSEPGLNERIHNRMDDVFDASRGRRRRRNSHPRL